MAYSSIQPNTFNVDIIKEPNHQHVEICTLVATLSKFSSNLDFSYNIVLIGSSDISAISLAVEYIPSLFPWKYNRL